MFAGDHRDHEGKLAGKRKRGEPSVAELDEASVTDTTARLLTAGPFTVYSRGLAVFRDMTAEGGRNARYPSSSRLTELWDAFKETDVAIDVPSTDR